MKRADGYAHVVKYTGLFGGVQGLTMLASIIRNKVVAVALGSVGMALIDIYNHVATLLSSLTTMGLSFSAVRSLSRLREEGDARAVSEHIGMLRSWTVWCAVLGTVLMAALSPVLSRLAFGSGEQTVALLLLSPMVGMLAITGMELAILKAMRRLKGLAAATTGSALWTLVVSVPAYVVWGQRAVVPVLLITTLGAMVAPLVVSRRVEPWRVSLWSRRVLGGVGGVVGLGVAYVVAASVGQAAELGVRAFVVRDGSLAMEGLYCAMFTLIVSYGRFMFTTMDADYFPRLSAQVGKRGEMSRLCSEQTEVVLLMMGPFLLLFALLLPIVVPLLLSSGFLGIIRPTLVGLGYMYFRAAVTPIAYMPLATGDGKIYVGLETAYYVYFGAFVCIGFHFWGLMGAAMGLGASTLVEFCLLSRIYGRRYGVGLRRRAWIIFGLQGCLLAGGIIGLLLIGNRPLAIGLGIVLVGIQTGVSLHYYKRKE